MSLFKSTGQLTLHTIDDKSIVAFLERAKAKITAPLPGVLNIYIQHADEPFFPFKDALTALTTATEAPEVNTHKEQISISTTDFTLQLGNDLHITLLDADGKQLLSTEKELNVQLKGTKMGIYFKLLPELAFVGLGEKSGPVNKRGRAYTHWNTDCFGYYDGTDPLYMTVPFMLVMNGADCFGIFLNNPGKTHFNLGASNDRFYSVTSEAGGLDLFFIQGKNPLEIIQRYTQLTGVMPLPPQWSLGLQQCRYSYSPTTDVQRIAQTYREKQLGLDVMYLDIHYMNAFKVFTWHPLNFPQPAQLTTALNHLGIKAVVIIDPGIKTEEGYLPYDSGVLEDVFIKYPDGTAYTADVWPGRCVFPDFTYSKAQQWWKKQFQKLTTQDGISGFWTDMNEPATWGQNTPEIIEHRWNDSVCSHDAIRNAYGMMMAKATHEAQLEHQPESRPFVLTRSGYSGVQRYAACWTGDNTANDEHMLLGVRLVCNLNAAGIAFCGPDIGGFIGNASAELFCRWMSIGTFTPLMRIHSMINSHANDPWSYGETTEIIARNYINLRYRLLPYLYAAFRLHEQIGTPVCTALILHEPANPDLLANRFQHQYFFGEAFMVAALESHKEYIEVYFPKKFRSYFHLFSGKEYTGSGTAVVHAPLVMLPVFVGAGSVFITQPTVLNTGEKVNFYELHVYRGNESYEHLWYEDDKSTFSYRTGNFAERTIQHRPEQRSLTISAQKGHYKSDVKQLRIILHHFVNVDKVLVNGREVALTKETYSWLAPLPNYDPLGEAELRFEEQVLTLSLTLRDEAVDIMY